MTWPLTFLANSCEWQERCRDEVRAVLSKHGESPNQPTSDVFAKMSLQSWESEFPVLQACLQETLRIGLTGTYLRKNVSGKEIPIGDTGQVIPAGSYAVCLPEYVHLDPDIFPDPLTFNPARSYERVAQGGPGSTMLLTWGTGRHTCRKSYPINLMNAC